MKQTERIEQLFAEGTLPRDELRRLIAERDAESAEELFAKARIRKEENFGKNVYLRGLIEFSSYCRNDCYYCGLRRSNTKAERYHLSKEEILTCARQGYELGFRTIVLQSGEDLSYSDEDIADIVRSIKREMPDVRVVVMTGIPEITFIEQAHAARADSFVYKNVSTAELLSIIRSTMEGYSTFPAAQLGDAKLEELDDEEIQILRLVCENKSRREIANELFLSEGTVKRRISGILAKTGYDSIMKLAVHAVSDGYIVPKLK